MNTSAVEVRVSDAEEVVVTEDTLTVELSDGRTISVPLAWYPRLKHGTKEERGKWRFIGGGQGIHWPDLDEDISVEGLLAGRPSRESQESLRRWLARKPAGRGSMLGSLGDAAGRENLREARREFWELVGERCAVDVPPGHAAGNLWWHFPRTRLWVSCCLLEGEVATFLRGYRGETKQDVRPRIKPHDAALKQALSRFGARLEGEWYWWVAAHQIASYDRDNWPQMADWIGALLQAYSQALGPADGPSGLRQDNPRSG